jgi:hypothetical protein
MEHTSEFILFISVQNSSFLGGAIETQVVKDALCIMHAELVFVIRNSAKTRREVAASKVYLSPEQIISSNLQGVDRSWSDAILSSSVLWACVRSICARLYILHVH